MNLVLADTSVWVAHFRRTNAALQSLIIDDRILCHPLIVIELACGTPPVPRERTLGYLQQLRQAVVATSEDVLAFIERHRCYDSGCGATDIALLASALLTRDARLWTLDKNLAALATRLGVGFEAASVDLRPM